ncbi:TPA: hypothetical protein ACWWDO_001947 [Enterococcus faecium]
MESYIETLVTQLYNLQMILDPEVISIGGGISKQTISLDYIRRSID